MFSQPVLITVLFIQTSFLKNTENELNVHRTIRSKTLINHFSSLWLCLSCDPVLEITKELSDTQIKHYMKNNV